MYVSTPMKLLGVLTMRRAMWGTTYRNKDVGLYSPSLHLAKVRSPLWPEDVRPQRQEAIVFQRQALSIFLEVPHSIIPRAFCQRGLKDFVFMSIRAKCLREHIAPGHAAHTPGLSCTQVPEDITILNSTTGFFPIHNKHASSVPKKTIITHTLNAMVVHLGLLDLLRAIFWATSLDAPLAYVIIELFHRGLCCFPQPTLVLSHRDAFMWLLRCEDWFWSVQHTMCPVAFVRTTHQWARRLPARLGQSNGCCWRQRRRYIFWCILRVGAAWLL
jgi:hypothetical protein